LAKSKAAKKIVSRRALAAIVRKLQKSGKTVVFTNGCFDLIHSGHITLFEKARAQGDALIVAINSDSSLKGLKGPRRPLVPQGKRAYVIAALESVDFVTVFNERTPAELVKALRPDILVKGGDYKIEEIVGREHVKKVVRVPLVKGQSTSELIRLIASRYGKC
jgi:rfaE bifunctional protein nucleotidyltransferase chain/domain